MSSRSRTQPANGEVASADLPVVPGYRLGTQIASGRTGPAFVAVPVGSADAEPVMLHQITAPVTTIEAERGYRAALDIVERLSGAHRGLLRVHRRCRTIALDPVLVCELAFPARSTMRAGSVSTQALTLGGASIAAALAEAHAAGLLHGRIGLDHIFVRRGCGSWALGGFEEQPLMGSGELSDRRTDVLALVQVLEHLLDTSTGGADDLIAGRTRKVLRDVAALDRSVLRLGAARALADGLAGVVTEPHAAPVARPRPSAPAPTRPNAPLPPRWPDPALDPRMPRPRRLSLRTAWAALGAVVAAVGLLVR